MKEMLSYFKDLDKKSTIILVASMFLMVIYMYQGNHSFFVKHLSHLVSDKQYLQWSSYGYQFLMANILFVLVPIVIIKFVFKENLVDYGLGLGDWRFGLKAFAIAFPITFPFLYLGAMDKEIQATYPLAKIAGQDVNTFLLWTLTYFTFYVAWEFMFRGFMQFGLRERFGAFGAIMFQVMASTLLHYDKPFSETFGAIIAGVIWGAVALRSRSIWYVLLFHWLFGLCNDVFSVWFRAGG